ncbi:ComEA family DNA-binding protein [Deinococcus sp. UYEF24]
MRTYTAILTALILSAAPVMAQTATPSMPAGTTKTMPSMPVGAAKTTTPAMPMTMAPMNVNTATEAQIAGIKGVGSKIAAAIVKARPFKNSADLIKRVKGIGPKNYLKLGLDKTFTY